MDRISEANTSLVRRTHRLICGDCLNVLPKGEANSVDVVMTPSHMISGSPIYRMTTREPKTIVSTGRLVEAGRVRYKLTGV